MNCLNLGSLRAKGDHPDVYHCNGGMQCCTLAETALQLTDGSPMPHCRRECTGFVELAAPQTPAVPTSREKARFCYFSGTNRSNEAKMIETMMRSARAVGVPEDFHIFSPSATPGAINHQFPANRDWKNHFAKVDILKELHASHPEYDYYVWLDTDSFFVRDPGDLSELIRNNKCWVSMESEVTSAANKHHGWQHIEKSHLVQWMREFGCPEKVYNTNGGMWIVRADAVDEFHSLAFDLRAKLDAKAGRRTDDEVVLAMLGQIMVPDHERNTFAHHKEIWACDWNNQWADAKGKLPDGSAWPQTDWLTGADLGMVNPAIVHAMRSKGLMAGEQWKWQGHAPQSPPADLQYLTCRHRGGATGKNLSCDCGVDKAIYQCDLHGECLKKLPTAKTKSDYGNQLDGVTLCTGCDGWKDKPPTMGIAWASEDVTADRPLRAVMLTPTLGMGGAEQWIRMLVTLSDPAKIRWRIVLLNDSSFHGNVIGPISKRENTEIHVVGKRIPHHACQPHATAADAITAAADGADILVAWGGGSWPLPVDLPTIFVAHGSCNYTRECLSMALAGGATNVVSVSHQAASAIGSEYPDVIWNGVDTERLKVTRDRTEIQKDAWKAQSEWWFGENVYVGYLGRLAAEKNAIAAAQAVSQLPWQYKCVLIGEGMEATAILEQARSLAGKRFTYVPSVDDVGNHLNAMDVVVCASHREGNSLSLIEAMIVGVPIVTTRVGAVDEFETAAGCELFWSLPDHPTGSEIAAVVRHAAMAGRSAERVTAARKFAKRHLTAETMERSWTQHLIRIVERSRKAA
jgi:glycosyltransferase involved in cell wall biosynthesis